MITEVVRDIFSNASVDYLTGLKLWRLLSFDDHFRNKFTYSFCLFDKKINVLHHDIFLRLLVNPKSQIVSNTFQKALKIDLLLRKLSSEAKQAENFIEATHFGFFLRDWKISFEVFRHWVVIESIFLGALFDCAKWKWTFVWTAWDAVKAHQTQNNDKQNLHLQIFESNSSRVSGNFNFYLEKLLVSALRLFLLWRKLHKNVFLLNNNLYLLTRSSLLQLLLHH